jgi:hypothetical protein
MTTIILTIIGIVLAASAALMTTFYGGSVFSSGANSTASSTVQSAGTSVLIAIEMYKSEKGTSPTSLADLKTAGVGGPFLKIDPVIPAGSVQSFSGTQYIVSGLTNFVCDRINSDLQITEVTQETSSFSSKMICIPSSSTTGTFYANS